MATRKIKSVALDIGKLNEILEVLKKYMFPGSKWFELGLKLGLLQSTLKDIEANYKGDVNRCLLECLTKWLTKADNSVGPFIWETLARAIKETGENAVCESIIKTMAAPSSQFLQQYSDKLSKIVLNERTIQLLHTEGVISEETATEVERYGCVLAGDSLREVYTAVAEDSYKLKVLADILMNTEEAVSLANEMNKEYDLELTFLSTSLAKSISFNKALVKTVNYTIDDKNNTGATAVDIKQGDSIKVSLYDYHEEEFDKMRTNRGHLLNKDFSLTPYPPPDGQNMPLENPLPDEQNIPLENPLPDGQNMPVENPPLDEQRQAATFLLLGVLGCGKSSLINSLLGRYTAEVSEDTSATPYQNMQDYAGNFRNIAATFIDTKGLQSTDRQTNDRRLIRDFKQRIENGVDIVFICHPFFTREDQGLVTYLKFLVQCFGRYSDTWHKSVIVLTKANLYKEYYRRRTIDEMSDSMMTTMIDWAVKIKGRLESFGVPHDTIMRMPICAVGLYDEEDTSCLSLPITKNWITTLYHICEAVLRTNSGTEVDVIDKIGDATSYFFFNMQMLLDFKSSRN